MGEEANKVRAAIRTREAFLEKLWKAADKRPDLCLTLGKDMVWGMNEVAMSAFAVAGVGSAKTESVLTAFYMHQLYRHQCGLLEPNWLTSTLRLNNLEAEAAMRERLLVADAELKKIGAEMKSIYEEIPPLRDEYLSLLAEKNAAAFIYGDSGELHEEATTLAEDWWRLDLAKKEVAGEWVTLGTTSRWAASDALPYGRCTLPKGCDEFEKWSCMDEMASLEAAVLPRFASTDNWTILKLHDAGMLIRGAEVTKEDKDNPVRRAGAARGFAGMKQAAEEKMTQITGLLNMARVGGRARANTLASKLKQAERKYMPLAKRLNELQLRESLLIYEREKAIAGFNLTYNTPDIRKAKYRRPPWGGLILDYKGNFFEYVLNIGRSYGRDTDLILLVVHPQSSAAKGIKPIHKFNVFGGDPFKLRSDDMAALIRQAISSAKSTGDGGGGGNKFYDAETDQLLTAGLEIVRMGEALHKLHGYKHEVPNIYRPTEKTVFYPGPSYIKKLIFASTKLDGTMLPEAATPEAQRANFIELLKEMGIPYRKATVEQGAEPFEKVQWMQDKMRKLDPEQRVRQSQIIEALLKAQADFIDKCFNKSGGSGETKSNTIASIYQVLAQLCIPEIEEVFASETTTSLEEINLGKHVCVSIPFDYAEKRTVITTLMAELYFGMIKNTRYTLSSKALENVCLAIGIFDEGHHLVTKSFLQIDTSRQYKSAMILSTQQVKSCENRLSARENEKMLGDTRTRITGKASTEACAEAHSKYYGEETYTKKSHSTDKLGLHSGISKNRNELRPLVPKHVLLSIPKFTFIINTPNREGAKGIGRYTICPLDDDGLAMKPWWGGDLAYEINRKGYFSGIRSWWKGEERHKKIARQGAWSGFLDSLGRDSAVWKEFGFGEWLKLMTWRRCRIGYQFGVKTVAWKRPLLGNFRYR